VKFLFVTETKKWL